MDVQEVQQGQQYRIFLDMTFNNETWIHYVYRNGGLAPNIVPDKASLYYFIRSREENMKEAVTAIMGTDIGLKAAMFAGEAMAQTALAVAGDPELLKKAWDEFHENYKEPYECIIPKED